MAISSSQLRTYPEIWIFRPIFHLENRSEDRDRPSTLSAWRRTLRQAVISASDRPERARPWIFAIENEDVIMEYSACADDDRHRTLAAKPAEALTNILKGEPVWKMALAAERAALSQEVLGGRYCLFLIY